MRCAQLGVLLVVGVAACAPQITRIPPPTGAVVEFWRDSLVRGQLFYGSGGKDHAPDEGAIYTLLKRDSGGFSTTLDLRDARGRKWSAKLGPEAATEVVASRIVWAMGYPQPPSYVAHVMVKHEKSVRDEGAARMRPHLEWLDNRGIWSWNSNPFVDTQAYRGLLVLMMVLNSTDLKDDNNALYLVQRNRPVLWYTVKDLGASLGDTGRFNPERGHIDEFERHSFIEQVQGPHVEFAFKGRHQHLLETVRPADVKWMCARLSRLSDSDWGDAFRAGGYSPEITRRYVKKIREKIRQGLALDRTGIIS